MAATTKAGFDPCVDCPDHRMMKDRWERVKNSLPRTTFWSLFLPAVALCLGYTTIVDHASSDRHKEQEVKIEKYGEKLDGIKKQVNGMEKTLIEIKMMQKFYLRQKGYDPEKAIDREENGEPR
jgi:dynactin complex subunit